METLVRERVPTTGSPISDDGDASHTTCTGFPSTYAGTGMAYATTSDDATSPATRITTGFGSATARCTRIPGPPAMVGVAFTEPIRFFAPSSNDEERHSSKPWNTIRARSTMPSTLGGYSRSRCPT
jgi:hypothetical protein